MDPIIMFAESLPKAQQVLCVESSNFLSFLLLSGSSDLIKYFFYEDCNKRKEDAEKPDSMGGISICRV